MSTRLATASVSARFSGIRGRAIVTAKNHHFVVDSPLSLGGPNEEINPIDLLLSALATHSAFVCERTAREKGIPLDTFSVNVTGEFDPRGLQVESVEPRLQAVTIRFMLLVPTPADAELLIGAVRTHCLIYTTLSRSTPIQIEIATSLLDDPRGKTN